MQISYFDEKVQIFIKTLEKPAIMKYMRMIDLLERFGHRLGLPHSKKIESNLFELRIRGRQEVRIVFTFHSAHIVILHGFIKKSNAIPVKELSIARGEIGLP